MDPETELERRLIERIKRDGALTFRDLMEAALYDPELGYYNTERIKIGPAGDYYTSSNVHPAFGAVLATSFVGLGLDRSPIIVEIGAGTGQLAYDVLSTIHQEHPALFDRITYIIVESSAHMRERQRARLSCFDEHVRWAGPADFDQAPINGIVFSNEFIDALPVHCIRRKPGNIEELYVAASGDEQTGLILSWGRPSTDKLSDYLERMQVSLVDDQIVEVNLDAVDWIARVSRALGRGFLVTIDYGDLAPHLWSSQRTHGTLRSFYRHRLIDSPLERIGEQDITASVNFTALIEYGRDYGFEMVSLERQTAFLTRMGLIERIAAMHRATESLDDLKSRLAVKNLFVPAGISDSFRVLIQKR